MGLFPFPAISHCIVQWNIVHMDFNNFKKLYVIITLILCVMLLSLLDMDFYVMHIRRATLFPFLFQ